MSCYSRLLYLDSYVTLSFTEWHDEAYNLVRIETESKYSVCVFSN